MKYFIYCVLYLVCQFSYASEIPEVTIEKQEVISWNHVQLSALDTARKDLADWCHNEYKNNCVGFGVKTYISVDKSTLFYEFSLTGVDGVFAIYLVKLDKERTLYGKSWVSAWEHSLIISSKKGFK